MGTETSVLTVLFAASLSISSLVAADDPPGKNLAFALQDAFASAIERAEPSLVSVVRIRTADGALADSLLAPLDDARQQEIRRLDTRRILRDRINASGAEYDPNW